MQESLNSSSPNLWLFKYFKLWLTDIGVFDIFDWPQCLWLPSVTTSLHSTWCELNDHIHCKQQLNLGLDFMAVGFVMHFDSGRNHPKRFSITVSEWMNLRVFWTASWLDKNTLRYFKNVTFYPDRVLHIAELTLFTLSNFISARHTYMLVRYLWLFNFGLLLNLFDVTANAGKTFCPRIQAKWLDLSTLISMIGYIWSSGRNLHRSKCCVFKVFHNLTRTPV